MSTDVAPVTLTYDSTDVQDLEGIFLEIVLGGPGEPSEIRGRNDIALGRDGQVVRNRRKNRRSVELVGWVKGTGSSEATQREDYWDNRIALETLFSTTSVEVLGVTLPNGDSYTLNCRCQPPILYKQITPSFATVSIELESVDPDWESGS